MGHMTDNHYDWLLQLSNTSGVEHWLAWQHSNAQVPGRLVNIQRTVPTSETSGAFNFISIGTRFDAILLKHLHAAAVFDIGEEQGTCWAVTEIVHGEALRVIVDRISLTADPVLHPAVTVRWMAQAASALHAAHTTVDPVGRPVQMVHGNLSPSSLLVTYEGLLKVIDFDKTPAQKPTAANMSYMSPEQCMGDELNASSDVFTLGVILWELLTGKRLFAQTEYFELMEAICEDDVSPPSKYNPNIPPFLDATVLKALNKKRGSRFSDCARMKSALEKVAGRLEKGGRVPNSDTLMERLFPQRRKLWQKLIQAEQTLDKASMILLAEQLFNQSAKHVAASPTDSMVLLVAKPQNHLSQDDWSDVFANDMLDSLGADNDEQGDTKAELHLPTENRDGTFSKSPKSAPTDWQKGELFPQLSDEEDATETALFFPEQSLSLEEVLAPSSPSQAARKPTWPEPQQNADIFDAPDGPGLFDELDDAISSVGDLLETTVYTKLGDVASVLAEHGPSTAVSSSPIKGKPQPLSAPPSAIDVLKELSGTRPAVPGRKTKAPPPPPVSRPISKAIKAAPPFRPKTPVSGSSRALTSSGPSTAVAAKPVAKAALPSTSQGARTVASSGPATAVAAKPIADVKPSPATKVAPKPIAKAVPSKPASPASEGEGQPTLDPIPRLSPKSAPSQLPPTQRLLDPFIPAADTSLDAFFDDEDDEDDDFVEPFSIETIVDAKVEPISPKEGGKKGSPVLEVVRVRNGIAVGSNVLWGLNRTYKPRRSKLTFALRSGKAQINVGEQITGEIRRCDREETPEQVSQDKGKLVLGIGDTAELRHDMLTYKVRFHRPPAWQRKRLTGAMAAAAVLLSVKTYGIALIVAVMLHSAALLAFETIGAMGVQLTTAAQPEQEVFAEGTLKKLPKEPKELKVAERPKPKPKPKPKLRPNPVDPTEQPVNVPKMVRKQLDKKLRQNKGAAGPRNPRDRTSSIVSSLKTPNKGEGTSLSEVVSNIDAPNKGARSAAFRVGGTLSDIPGADGVQIANGGSRDLGALTTAPGKDVGKLEKRKAAGGKVRGKVTSMRSAARVQGDISRSDVLRVIGRIQGRVQGCYEKALLTNPNLSGKVTVRWTIGTSGRVSGAGLASSTLNNAKVAQCIIGAVRGLKFPKPTGGPVTVVFPWIFRTAS